MMKDNFNKLLQDKLKDASYPFDEAAWTKMEQMLDKKSDKGLIFWWWFAGLSTVALLSFGAYLKFFKTGNNINPTIAQNIIAGNIEDADLAAQNSVVNFSDATNSSANQNQSEQNNNSSQNTNSINSTITNTSLTGNKTSLPKSNIASGKNSKEPNNASSFNLNELKALSPEDLKRKDFPVYYWAEGDMKPGKKEDESLLNEKEKRNNSNGKKVSFQPGIFFFAGATTTGLQTDIDGNLRNGFSGKASYSIGYMNDIAFGKRWAISTGILYGKSHFRIYQPLNYSVLLNNYESTSQLLQIPLGVKFYTLSKQKFRLYATTGIVSNLQIKETLEFVNAAVEKPSASIEISINSGISDESANFDSGFLRSYSDDQKAPEFFSVNKSSRYYMQYYAGFGAEYVIANKLIIFAEPRFHTDIQQIGLQNRRASQFGFGSGLRWKF